MLSLIVDSRLRLPLGQLSPELLEKIKKEFTFKISSFGKKTNDDGMIEANWKSNKIKGWRETRNKKELIIPRGATSVVVDLLKSFEVEHQIINKTRIITPVDFEFHGELRQTQIKPVEAILGKRFSTISAPTATGKTTLALYTVAQRKVPTLIVVHTKKLLKQWIERSETFLGINPDEIGIIGDGKMSIGNRLTVAMVQTLHKCAKQVYPYIGYLIIDECHHLPCNLMTKAVSVFDCGYMLGLSATHKRRDGLTPMIYWYLGECVFDVKLKDLVKEGSVVMVDPIIRMTDFMHSSEINDASWERSKLMDELIVDEKRNLQIVNDVIYEAQKGQCVVLSDRKIHCEILSKMINEHGVKSEFIHSDVKEKESDRIINDLKEGRLKVVVVTGALLGEGFDEKNLNALFLAMPIRFRGRVIQYLGRVSRSVESNPDKKAVVYDYVDRNVNVLAEAASDRMRTYNKLKRDSKKGKK